MALRSTLQHMKNSQMLRKLRVVCLHGWRTNETVLEHQTEGLRKAFGDRAEFFFVRAPYDAKGPAFDIVQLFYGPETPYYEWYDAIHTKDPMNSKKITHTVFDGVDGSLEYLMDRITEIAQQEDAKISPPWDSERGGIDVLLGFSQGAVMATMLTAHLQNQQRQVPWKVCVLVCGVDVTDTDKQATLLRHENGLKKPVAIDSIHWLGMKDEYLDDARRLVERYPDPEPRDNNAFQRIVVLHQEGHKFPTIGDASQQNMKIAEATIRLVERWHQNNAKNQDQDHEEVLEAQS